MTFVFEKVGPYNVQVFQPWQSSGLRHGFIGASSNFAVSHFANESSIFCETFGVASLIVPNQIHSDVITDLRSAAAIEDFKNSPRNKLVPSDGIIISRDKREMPIAIGVRTADCLPVIIRSESEIAVVHAGWRGLASHIVPKAMKMFAPGSKLEIIIGPAASIENYEVGHEVVDAIGHTAVHELFADGKIHLSTTRTCVRQIHHEWSVHSVFEVSLCEWSPICTIADSSFHSFRRQKEDRGSNLAFAIV